MHRRPVSETISEAHAWLDAGDTARAVALLEHTLGRRQSAADRRLLLVELAAACLLEGDGSLDLALSALDALAAQPGRSSALELALFEEAALLTRTAAAPERASVQAAFSAGDPRAHFHIASALLLADEFAAATVHLAAARSAGSLPDWLRWRCWSLTGVAFEQIGDFGEAASAIRQALELAPAGEHRELERLALADCLLETGDPAGALAELAHADQQFLTRTEDLVCLQWLHGRAEEQLGNPGLAIQRYRRARDLLVAGGSVPPGSPFDFYSLLSAEAQLLADRGAWEEAVALYQVALADADPEQASFTRHELAVVLIEAGQGVAAAEQLRLVAADDEYGWRAEALAELADLVFRDGDNAEAERLARKALELKPVPAAFLCMGSLALDYFRLDEAVSWFERAAEAASSGDPAWVAAQQLLADTFAQMGPENAERLYRHAQLALRYTDRRNDWYLPLRGHAELAVRVLAGQRRLVN